MGELTPKNEGNVGSHGSQWTWSLRQPLSNFKALQSSSPMPPVWIGDIVLVIKPWSNSRHGQMESTNTGLLKGFYKVCYMSIFFRGGGWTSLFGEWWYSTCLCDVKGWHVAKTLLCYHDVQPLTIWIVEVVIYYGKPYEPTCNTGWHRDDE